MSAVPIRNPLATSWVVASVGILCLAESAAILIATQGHFTYSLDDAYIHLDLARQIEQGHYGFQAGQASSPSSSFLWPFILASLGAAGWLPLALNVVFTLASAIVVCEIVALMTSRTVPLVALTVGAMTCMNFIGVAFTGMEHSAQILVSLIAGLGVVRVVQGRPPGTALMLALAIGPGVRYENLAVTVAGAAVLWHTGFRRHASVALAVPIAYLTAFSVFLVHLGLGPLPSSILAKSRLADGNPLHQIYVGVGGALSHPLFAACLVVVACDYLLTRKPRAMHVFVLGILIAHALGGRFGWWGRYELYVYAACLAPLLAMAKDWTVPHRARRMAGRLVVATLVVASLPLLRITLLTPLASAGIAGQQGVLASFVAHDWQGPIAVNDIGLVGLRGDQPVLDLWGLANADALAARRSGAPNWLGSLVARHDIQLVAIYKPWFGDVVPSSWLPVGEIVRAAPNLGGTTISIFATDPGVVERACAALHELQRSSYPPQTSVLDAPLCSAQRDQQGVARTFHESLVSR